MKVFSPFLNGDTTTSGSLNLPQHPTSASIANPNTGSIYHDTTDNIVKVYTGTQWQVLGEQTTPTVVASADIEYLLIAGGGGGGNVVSYTLGGGGAGGYLSSSLASVSSGSSFTVTVGSGGAKGSNDGSDSSIAGTTISTITSTGGGGGSSNIAGGRDGGSGGGGGNGVSFTLGGSGTVGQGNDGGDSPGANRGAGGGGAGAAGSDSVDANGGDGGAGLSSSITGASTARAGGGGGGSASTGASGGTGGSGGGGNGESNNSDDTTSGTENTGGGGGGSFETATNGAGGSGVAIFAYDSGSINGAGGIVGDAGNGRKYHQFNVSSTFKVGSTSDFVVDTTSLQFYYDAGDYASRGTSTITDTQGNYNGTANGAAFVLGNNYYWTFNGTNHTISNSFTRPASAQTFMFWVRYLGDGANGYNLSGFQENPAYFYLGRINSTNNVYYYAGDGNASGEISSTSISNNVWVLQTLTMDASGITTVYTNTTSIHTGADGLGSAGTHTFRMGAINSVSTNYYINADVGIVAYYTKHFSSSDVTNFYEATKTNFV